MNLTELTHAQGIHVTTGSGMDGARARVCLLLGGPAATVVVVEHRGRLGRMNTELVEAALAANGRRLVVAGGSEVTGDLVRKVVEVLTLLCVGRHGRRRARNRALEAVGCARRDVGPLAVLRAGGAPCGGAG